MMPDSLPGLAIRMAAIERGLEEARTSRARMWEAIHGAEVGDAELKAVVKELHDAVVPLEVAVNELRVELAVIKAKVAIYGALGSLIGGGIVSLVVSLAVGG